MIKLLSLDPNNIDAYNAKGKAFAHLKNYKAAIECFDKAINLKPNLTTAYINKGVTLEILGDYEAIYQMLR